MKVLQDINRVYFLGIGGIGMSALARYFYQNKKEVAGYDKTLSEITQALADEGIAINTNDNVAMLPSTFLDAQHTLIVYTPAIPSDNKLLKYFEEHQFNIKKRAEVLGMITKDIPTLAIAGTHGKTTTTAMLAHILKVNNIKLTAFLGGISENYKTNYIGEGNDVIVVEADEFDRSFLHLSPTIASITSMDADHLDIYSTHESLLKSFQDFSQKIIDKDNLFKAYGLNIEGHSVGFDENAEYKITNVDVCDGIQYFDFLTPNESIKKICLKMPGKHNLMNAAIALSMANKFGISLDKATVALATFKGVDRRFTYHLNTLDKIVIEDYAHHPTEIKAVYEAIRNTHKGKKIQVIFQPHLYTRTRDFAQEFINTLEKFDEVVLTEIYPAREKPIVGINAELLLKGIKNEYKQIAEKEDLPELVKQSKAEVSVILGAGDIGDCVAAIIKKITNES